MVSSKMLHRLATHPSDMLRFQATGKLPESLTPSGPLIDLLRKITPRDLAAIKGVTISEKLGYAGSRQFHCATQALRWVAPDTEQFSSWSAESWRNKRNFKILHIEDLLEQAASAPEGLADKYPHLRRSAPL